MSLKPPAKTTRQIADEQYNSCAFDLFPLRFLNSPLIL
jgi:hypothetical protein